MALPNIFNEPIANEVIGRIKQLTPGTSRLWGSMDVAQMLAHCNVTYEMVYESKHPAPNAFMKFIFKKLVKNKVVGEAPFPRNSRTAPAFIVKEPKNFEVEKKRLVDYIIQTQKLGEGAFNNKPSLSFGPLTTDEWNNMFYKHLNHHLTQFGV